MVEYFMEQHITAFVPIENVDAYTGLTTPTDVSYRAVAVASPQAQLQADSRLLNVGHYLDLVYGIIGADGSTMALNIELVHPGIAGFTGFTGAISEQHSSDISYVHTVRTLLSSSYYAETDRESNVIIVLKRKNVKWFCFFG